MGHDEYKRLLWEQHLAKVAEKDRLSEADRMRGGERKLKKDDPEYRREYMRKWREAHPVTDEQRRVMRERDRWRYWNDPDFRERKKEQSRKTRMKRAQEG